MLDFLPRVYSNANEAFDDICRHIYLFGYVSEDTKKLDNISFEISNPLDRDIEMYYRKWSKKYAEREWNWYQSRNRSVEEIKKYAPIWDKMHGGDNIVNSNYGYQIHRNNQVEKVIEQLRKNNKTRQAWISIFDGKEKDEYEFDTPCTLNLGFTIGTRGELNMRVLMRSNDLWYGFCNDQYCFSKIQEEIANKLEIPVGSYFHYAADMHLYLDKVEEYENSEFEYLKKARYRDKHIIRIAKKLVSNYPSMFETPDGIDLQYLSEEVSDELGVSTDSGTSEIETHIVNIIVKHFY